MNIVEIKNKVKKIIPPAAINAYHFCLAFFGAARYGFPSRKIKVIGVTGTNGKSTTVIMVSRILEQAGYKAAVSSSIEFRVGDKSWKNKTRMTMPGRFALQKLLSDGVKSKCQYAVIEVSSEGIKQHRHRFIDFEAVLATNVTPEHIESHGSFENYLNAKGKLFKSCQNIHIINLDDANFDYFAKFAAKTKYAYGIDNAKNIQKNIKIVKAQNYNGLSFEIDGTKFDLKLNGKFNVYNALAAICVGLSQGISLDVCQKALREINIIPGRMEQIIFQPFSVFIDYAVTPDSLEKAYQTAKGDICDGKLICVLGACGGGRDKWKRSVMGKIAQKYCDQVILTNEDPYDEDPQAILDQIAYGSDNVRKIIDRREAIAKALKISQKGDVVMITGKGCEESMCLAHGKKIPWNDKNIAKEEMGKLF